MIRNEESGNTSTEPHWDLSVNTDLIQFGYMYIAYSAKSDRGNLECRLSWSQMISCTNVVQCFWRLTSSCYWPPSVRTLHNIVFIYVFIWHIVYLSRFYQVNGCVVNIFKLLNILWNASEWSFIGKVLLQLYFNLFNLCVCLYPAYCCHKTINACMYVLCICLFLLLHLQCTSSVTSRMAFSL